MLYRLGVNWRRLESSSERRDGRRNHQPNKKTTSSKISEDSDMKLSRLVFLVIAVTSFSVSVFAQDQKVITAEMAQTMVQEAIAKCRADGLKVTVLVVDGLNAPKAMLRDDGAAASTTEVAKQKATATLWYNRPSGPPQPLPPGTTAPVLPVPGTINAPGGIPIKVGDVTIGAIAVSGAPTGDRDAACANAGLAKVADKLK
jgi:uncharacterized protein GlcG (DUF336 family)